MRLIDTVAWRSPAISRYESVIAVQQRFCVLNSTQLRQFLDFAEQAKSLVRPGKHWVNSRDLLSVNMQRLGKVLAEGKLLEFSNPDCYYPKGIYREEQYLLRDFWYCPKCMGRGYHTLAHQVGWLDRCLIHGEKLVNECSCCGVRLKYNRTGRVPLSAYCCTSCSAALWPDHAARTWPVPLTASELAPITDYVKWVAKWRSAPRLAALGRAGDFASWKDPADRVNEMKSIIQRPSSVVRAWCRRSSPPARQFRSCFAAEKSRLVVEGCRLFGPNALTRFVTTTWRNATGLRSRWHAGQVLASHIERHHANCRKVADESLKEVESDDCAALINQLCLPCHLASRLRFGLPEASPNRPMVESASPDLVALRDWLIASGLLVRAGGLKSSPDAVSEREGENRWMFDRALLWLVKIFVREDLWSFVSWFLDCYAVADQKIDVLERENDFSEVGWPDDWQSGVFLLPFTKRGGELVVMAWWDNAGTREPQKLIAYDATHAEEVARRADVIQAFVRFTTSERLRRQAEAFAVFRTLRR